jgi:tetraacyldisaccharide 4'-kinase
VQKLLQIILVPLSWLYALVLYVRNIGYDLHFFHVERVSVPVISVGNITAGGTGKTPFVEYLLGYLLKKNKKVAVISRGYKRSTSGTVIVSDGGKLYADACTSGDEPYQVARKYPKVVVIVDERRVRAAKLAIQKFGVDVILLDDGFQHRALGRDVDIVLVDVKQSLRGTLMLPAGLRRESLSSMRRADVLAFTHVSDSRMRPEELNQHTSAKTIKVNFIPKLLFQVYGTSHSALNGVNGKSCVAFCGIGQPEYFRTTLSNLGLKVVDFHFFSDHHFYTIFDLKKIQKSFENFKAQIIVTTEKDAVRLLSIELPVLLSNFMYYVEIGAQIIEGENLLHRLIDTKLKGAA